MPGVRGGAPDGARQGQLHGCGRRDVLWRDAEPVTDSAGTTQPASTSRSSTTNTADATNPDATNTDADADADTNARTGLEPHIRRLLHELGSIPPRTVSIHCGRSCADRAPAGLDHVLLHILLPAVRHVAYALLGSAALCVTKSLVSTAMNRVTNLAELTTLCWLAGGHCGPDDEFKLM